MKPIAVCLIAAVVGLAANCQRAAAEVFLLSNGGRVAGELLNRDEKPRQKFVVRVGSGGRITLDPSQVKQVLYTRPEELEYEKIRPRHPDTVQGQWALAEWCRQHQLMPQRRKHLTRIVELDPEHAEARRALGYSQVGGRWKTQEEVMIERGYKRYKGRWRLPQEIELLEKRRNQDLAEKEWFQKVKRWRGWLGSDRDALGRRNIVNIDDPVAVKALASGLQKKDEPWRVRLLYVEALANVGTPAACKALAAASLEDKVEEVRLTCLDYLQKQKHPAVVPYFVGKLRSKDNRIVNRAGMALGRMNDPSAIGPLIDALVTTHKFKVITSKPGGISTGFNSSGGGGLSMGGKPKIIKREIPNQAVLDSLVRLSGQNFNYDKRAWKYWFASQKGNPLLDARRG